MLTVTRFAVLPKQQLHAPSTVSLRKGGIFEETISFPSGIHHFKLPSHNTSQHISVHLTTALRGFLNLLRHIEVRIGLVVPAAAIASAKDMDHGHCGRRCKDSPAKRDNVSY